MNNGIIVIFSHKTAFKIYRAVRILRKVLENHESILQVSSGYAGLETNLKNEGLYEFVQKPYDIFVPRRNLRYSNSCVKAHSITPSKAEKHISEVSIATDFRTKNHIRNIRKINDSLGLVSPELLFFQLVQSQGPITALEAGLEMCGTYSVDIRNSGMSCNLQPITSAQKIKKFIAELSENTKYLKSIKIAKRFVKYLSNNSASPQESKLYLKLSLPKTAGGLGLSNFLFNYPVVPSSYGSNQTKKQFFYCDLANPVKKVAIEYDSRQYHSSGEEILADRAKKETLQGMGWKVFTFTVDEAKDPKMFNEKCEQIARALGRKTGDFSAYFLKKQLELFDVLDG